jgi:hypothetical protein
MTVENGHASGLSLVLALYFAGSKVIMKTEKFRLTYDLYIHDFYVESRHLHIVLVDVRCP